MKITDAESLVMEALWKKHPRTSEDLILELAPRETWSEATIRTLLGRLVKKGAVEAKGEGRRYLYSPLIERSDYLHAESESLVDRLFGGEVAPMVANFAKNRRLKAKDIKALKKLLSELEDGDDK
ncbi:MAG TPA: BlaI/MecI/CopY family transcriptional regulator [Hyphomonadaceae bacterium]|jgi:predicted transcriptional regulator|nr:BlaI/MecI/CopY family transcriptional regulator [Hyphomonadaceae bacterium]